MGTATRYNFLSSSQNTPIGQTTIYVWNARNSAGSTIRCSRLVNHKHGKPPAVTNSMARSSSHFRANDNAQGSRRATRKMVIDACESPIELGSMDLSRQYQHTTSTGILILCCPTDLDSRSAITGYVILEYGHKAMFRRQLAVGKALHLLRSLNAPWKNDSLAVNRTRFFWLLIELAISC